MYRYCLNPLFSTSNQLLRCGYTLGCIFFISLNTSVNSVWAEEYTDQDLWKSPGIILDLLRERELYPEEVPNPHWQDGACVACHTGRANFGKANIRSADSTTLCGNCHNSLSKPDYSHPSGAVLSAQMWRKIPPKFRRSVKASLGNKKHIISCRTCHDMPMQCLKSRRHEKPANPNFLRLGPYRQRTDMCFYCHNPRSFKRLTPHKQIVSGKLDQENCKICHQNTRILNASTKLKDVRFPDVEDLSELCINCHEWRPHPGWEFSFTKKKTPNHLVKPSADMRKRMNMMQQKTGIILPIGQSSGKIHCGTCHNPHQKGVVKSKHLNTGADSRKRMRMKKTCSYCHDI